MKLKKNLNEIADTQPEIKDPMYAEGASKIQFITESLCDEIKENSSALDCKNYVQEEQYRKEGHPISEMIDGVVLRYLASIKAQNLLPQPFEYLMFGVMLHEKHTLQNSVGFWAMQALTCRLVDTHFYYKKALAGDIRGREALTQRGWFGKKSKNSICDVF